jgi:hypothetical protein
MEMSLNGTSTFSSFAQSVGDLCVPVINGLIKNHHVQIANVTQKMMPRFLHPEEAEAEEQDRHNSSLPLALGR